MASLLLGMQQSHLSEKKLTASRKMTEEMIFDFPTLVLESYPKDTRTNTKYYRHEIVLCGLLCMNPGALLGASFEHKVKTWAP